MNSTDVRQPQIKKEISAECFGMMPETENNTEAFAEALRICKENGINRLNIKPGVYHFTITQSFYLTGMKDFEIYALDVRFVFYSSISNTEQITFFRLNCCDTIKFTGLSIDWNVEKAPLASLVKVENVTVEYVDLRCMEEREIPEKSLFVTLNAVNPQTFTPGVEGGREYNIDGNQSESFLKRERISERLYRCWFKEGKAGEKIFKTDDYYLIRHYLYNGGVFLIEDCRNMVFEDFSIYGAPGSGFDVRRYCSHFYFHRMHVTLPEYDRRYITTTVDAVHLCGTDGYMLFEDCDIGYQGDDGINIYNTAYIGAKTVEGKTDTLVLNAVFRKGDWLSFAKADLSPTGYVAEIVDAECIGDRYRYALSVHLPKEVVEKSIIYNLSRDSSHFVIRRCCFHENRARGILAQADDGLIENCEFYHIQGAAIQIETGVSRAWCEGRGVKNLVIRNNRMIGCDVNDWDKGVIYMSTYTREGIPIKNSDYPNPTSRVGDSGLVFRSTYPVFRNITIENNLIEEYPRRAMILTSFDGLKLRNNTFRNNIARKHNNPDRGSILIAYGTNLTEENNVFEPSSNMLMPYIIAER